MLFTKAAMLFGMLGAAAADCVHNNCLRQVIASAYTTRMVSADCSSFMMITVTPATVTMTATATQTSTVTTDVISPQRRRALKERTPVHLTARDPVHLTARQATVSPTHIPAYASSCLDDSEYSSACSCIGITGMTTTVAAPSATVTVTATTTTSTTASEPVPTLVINQFLGSDSDQCDPNGSTYSVTITPGQCGITDDSNSLDFASYTPSAGSCGCMVQFYGDFGCAGTYGAPVSPASAQCYDANPIYAAMLICGC